MVMVTVMNCELSQPFTFEFATAPCADVREDLKRTGPVALLADGNITPEFGRESRSFVNVERANWHGCIPSAGTLSRPEFPSQRR
jgi:hypothetical protein